MKFYMHYRPVIDIPSITVGIAYSAIPEDVDVPTTLQCNMGFMDGEDSDLLNTGSSTLKMMSEMMDMDAKKAGFCGDIVAEFPISGEVIDPKTKRHIPGSHSTFGHIRQMNLSAWTSVKASHDWYVNSQTHKDIVAMHNAGANSKTKHLESFSAMLMQCEALKPARYHLRCTGCQTMNVKGYPENKSCVNCGASLHMPMF